MNKYKVFQVLPMYNVHPYFFLHKFGQKSVHYTLQNMVINYPSQNSFERNGALKIIKNT